MAVLVGIADAQLPPVFQLDAPGTLDLQELQVHRVVQPGQHRRLHAFAADGVGIVVGLQHIAFQTATQALALEFGIDAVQRDDDQVLGHAVDRHRRVLGGLQAAGVDRFVVAGDQALRAIAGGVQAVHLQVRFEELAHRGGLLRHLGGVAAGRGPDRVLGQPGAGGAPGVEAAEHIGIAGGRQVAPLGLAVGGDLGGFAGVGFIAIASCQYRSEREGAEQEPAPMGESDSHAMNPGEFGGRLAW
ncbi:hypothetical protein D3C76_877790 [compost metagenome]